MTESQDSIPDISILSYNVCEILDLIAQHCDGIKQCRGKTVAAVFGVAQVGKTTAINALVHGPLIVKSRRWGMVTYTYPEGSGIKHLAEMGDGRARCTQAPQCFCLGGEGSDVVLLDTRGFFDDRCPNETIASTLLTQAALDDAKEVKLVFLQRCDPFFKGHIGMMQFGSMFGDLVRSNDIPALFLFNNFPWSVPDTDDVGTTTKIIEDMQDKWKDTEREKDEQMNEVVGRIITRILKSPNNPVAEVKLNYKREEIIDMVLGKKKTSGSEQEQKLLETLDEVIKNDPEYKEEQKKMLYLEALSKAFNECVTLGSFGSTSKSSNLLLQPDAEATRTRERSRSPVRSASPVPKLVKIGGPYIGYIEPTNLWSIESIRAKIRKLPCISVGILDFPQFVKPIEQFYDYFVNKISSFSHLLEAQQKTLAYSKDIINQLITSANEEIKKNEKALDELLRQGKDAERKYFPVYDEDRTKRLEKLRNTRRGLTYKTDQIKEEIRLIENDPHYVQIERPIEWRKEVRFWKYTVNFSMSYPIVWEEEWSSDTTERIVHVQNQNQYSVTFIAGSKTRGLFSLFTPKVKTYGKITFYALPKDIPANARIIEEKKKTLEELEKKRSKVNHKLAEEEKAFRAELPKMMEDSKANAEKTKQLAEDFEKYRTVCDTLYKKYTEPRDGKPSMLDLYYICAQVLYPEKRTKPICVQQFLTLYASIKSAEVKSMEASEITQEELDVSSDLMLLQEEFKADL